MFIQQAQTTAPGCRGYDCLKSETVPKIGQRGFLSNGRGRGWKCRLSRLFPLFFLVLIVLPVGPDRAQAAAPRIGSALPSLTLPDVGGMPFRIPDSVRGKVTVLHFWQVGCSSCKLEMPAMNDLYRQYRRRGLEILAVNVGQKKEVVQGFVADLGATYPLLIDADAKSAAVYGATDVPRTYLIDRKGIVRYRILGGVAPEMLKKLVLSLL